MSWKTGRYRHCPERVHFIANYSSLLKLPFRDLAGTPGFPGAGAESVRHLYRAGQAPWGDETIAPQDEFTDFLPIRLAPIETKSHPAPRADIGRKVKASRLSGHERLVLVGQRLARNRDNLIPVMIVQKVRKGFLANQKGGMPAAVSARGFG